jgi:hypothetical protein
LGDEETAGFMAEARVHAFANWLVQHQLEDARILSKTLFTNALLEKIFYPLTLQHSKKSGESFS